MTQNPEEELKLAGHVNNLYNTTFWALIQLGGMDAKGAEKELAVGSFTS
jgi:tRNA(His) guanylyltransferase